MKAVAAFFDVDGTIINTNSMISFYMFFIKNHEFIDEDTRADRLESIRYRLERYNDHDRVTQNTWYYSLYSGEDVSYVNDMVEKWFLRLDNKVWNPLALEMMKEHIENDVPVILVSGASDFILRPLKKALNCSEVVSTQLEIKEDKYTGSISRGPMIGDNKVKALKFWVKDRGVDEEQCYGYGDHISDAGMLNFVGVPTAVNPDKELRALALSRGWAISDNKKILN